MAKPNVGWLNHEQHSEHMNMQNHYYAHIIPKFGGIWLFHFSIQQFKHQYLALHMKCDQAKNIK